jgi:hypothetical protein
MRNLPNLTEDRGDGRSRIHMAAVEVYTTARLTVQRDGDVYHATLRRIGVDGFPGDTILGTGETLKEAIRAALTIHGLY